MFLLFGFRIVSRGDLGWTRTSDSGSLPPGDDATRVSVSFRMDSVTGEVRLACAPFLHRAEGPLVTHRFTWERRSNGLHFWPLFSAAERHARGADQQEGVVGATGFVSRIRARLRA
jgi:hypothetical protein